MVDAQHLESLLEITDQAGTLRMLVYQMIRIFSSGHIDCVLFSQLFTMTGNFIDLISAKDEMGAIVETSCDPSASSV